MKKFKILLLALLITGSVFAEETILEEKLGEYAINIGGDVTFMYKNQDSYYSPFDAPMFDGSDRAGASGREYQKIRTQANLNFYSGNPGVSEWFGILSLTGDVNSPDNTNVMYEPTEGEILNRAFSEEVENKLSITNAFVMWRPLELMGGRPLGISVGNQTIKATANAAYSNMFSGDMDSDFIGYTVSALVNKPMISVDLHVTPNTGVGYSYVEGTSDMILNCSSLDNDYAKTQVLWGEFEMFGLGGNIAYQMAKGDRSASKGVVSEYSDDYYNKVVGGENGKDGYTEYNYTGENRYYTPVMDKYESTNLNVLAYYKLKYGSIEIKPFYGYQKFEGEEATHPVFGRNEGMKDKVAIKETEVSVSTIGTSVKFKKLRLSGEVSSLDVPDFGGLGGIQDGFVDQRMQAGVMPMAGMEYDMTDHIFAGIAGTSKTSYSFAGLEKMYHFEIAYDLNEKVTISAFMNGQITKDVDVNATDEQKEAMTDALVEGIEDGTVVIPTSTDNPTAAVAGLIDSQMGGAGAFSAEKSWAENPLPVAAIQAIVPGITYGQAVNNADISAALNPALAGTGYTLAQAAGSEEAAVNGVVKETYKGSAGAIVGMFADINAVGDGFGTEWSDSEVYGMSITYRF